MIALWDTAPCSLVEADRLFIVQGDEYHILSNAALDELCLPTHVLSKRRS
jgi:hypothetical protein